MQNRFVLTLFSLRKLSCSFVNKLKSMAKGSKFSDFGEEEKKLLKGDSSMIAGIEDVMKSK